MVDAKVYTNSWLSYVESFVITHETKPWKRRECPFMKRMTYCVVLFLDHQDVHCWFKHVRNK